MEFKFKIGDRIRYTPDEGDEIGYDFGNGDLKKGAVVTVASIKPYQSSQSYGFKEDKMDKGNARWLYVEKNFELVSQPKKVKPKPEKTTTLADMEKNREALAEALLGGGI